MTDNLNSVISKIKDNKKTVEDLRSFLQPEAVEKTPVDKKEITVDQNTFELALQCKDTNGAVIRTILLHLMQNPKQQLLKDVMKHLDEVCLKNGLSKELLAFINSQDNKENTLLHHAVIHNNAEAITALFEFDINPLIKNTEDKTPLDLNQGVETRKVLIEGMRKQVSSKKEKAMCSSLSCIVPCGFLGAGMSIVSALVHTHGGMVITLGIMVAFALIGIAVGLAIYFLSQDYKQAKAIENAIGTSSKLSSVERMQVLVQDKQPTYS